MIYTIMVRGKSVGMSETTVIHYLLWLHKLTDHWPIMSMTLPIEIHYDSTMLMHFCHFGFFPLTFVPIVQSTSLIIGHLSPCFTLSAILVWVTPRYLWLYPYPYQSKPVPVLVLMSMGFCRFWHGFLGGQWVLQGSVGTVPPVPCNGGGRWYGGAVVWMSNRHISVLTGGSCTTLQLLVQPPALCPLPFLFSVSISHAVAMFACGSILHCVSVGMGGWEPMWVYLVFPCKEGWCGGEQMGLNPAHSTIWMTFHLTGSQNTVIDN